MQEIINGLNGIVWCTALVFLFLAAGLFFSIATRFPQLRHLKDIRSLIFEKGDSKSEVSAFQGLTMTLASRVGIGNIAGVAAAIAYGGPGALFWMWVMAFFGAATSFVETTLAQVYKEKDMGELRGGPPFYIEKGLKLRWLAVLYAAVTVIAQGILLPPLQANTVTAGIENAFGIQPSITGGILVLVLAAIIFGGVTRIAKFAEIIVPFMAIGYIVVCFIVLGANVSEIPQMFVLIIRSALGMDATYGAMIGYAISWGIQRGLYSNAAGVGSEIFGAAAVEVSHPAKQGLVQSFAVYVDTLIVCSATGFMILITGMYDIIPNGTTPLITNLGDVEPGAVYTQRAIESVLPGFGSPFIAIAVLFFAFTTIVAYYYSAETCLAYILGEKKKIWMRNILGLLVLGAVYYGSVNTAEIGWGLGDLGIGSMGWINIIVILFLSKKAFKLLKDYEIQKKKGKNPVFDPVELGIADADYWEKEYKNIEQNNCIKNQEQ
ncbi:alanine/glycine:cation symporter family protein [Niallia endozanthoxylica]|uniref:Alanine:cation symporter family protein n=1 Tax=Niallia endozanthoxylica TaxID=2036016 RepID=A0A5J5I420_9BACI|nr:alanine/glycine:cation symporter family protein [Niallia endozanthoxylica]KAA9031159.1 alanine:cation symporter family protein [Niallia endozanthoxylica]